MKEPKYCVVGNRPVKTIPNKEGGLGIYAMNWNTGEFKRHPEYMSQIYFGTMDDVEELSEKEFNTYVEKLKKEKGL